MGKKSCHFDIMDNILELPLLSGNEIIDFLKKRYLKAEFYTWAGVTLVAINPCQNITELYTDVMKAHFQSIWKDEEVDKIEPHIYAVASKAKYNMLKKIGKVNQAIILTGESGSGKTCSATHVLDFLIYTNTEISTGSPPLTSLCQRANLVLKAFGNASTVFNNDSSRFGKLLSTYWSNLEDYSTIKISGAHLQIYLLEKTRVVNTDNSCGKNFHIFYQVLSGMNDDESNALHFPASKEFRIAKITDSSENEYELHETARAIKELGVTEQDWKSVICILAAILHLGNVEFENDAEDVCSIKNNDASIKGMQYACELLGVEEDLFTKLLTSKLIITKFQSRKSRNNVDSKRQRVDLNYPLETLAGYSCQQQRNKLGRSSVFRKSCSAHESSSRKDSILCFIYQSLFQWVLEQVNASLFNPPINTADNRSVIGILDIFGFEDFENNNLEQLCINYTNERIHQYYVKNNFIDYQKMMEEEGFLSLKQDFFCDNLSRLELFESSPSIFGILNDESIMNRRYPDENIFRRISSISSPHLSSCTKNGHQFIVSHYAGNVCYNVKGMPMKNADKAPWEIVEFLTLSESVFVRDILNNEKNCSHSRQTLLQKFMESLKKLMSKLDSKDVHFVRCLKPNQSLSAGTVDSAYCLRQLKYAGIMDLISLKLKVFPLSMKYEEFFERYKVLVKSGYISKGAPRSKDALLQPHGDSKISMDCESKWQTGCRYILSRVLEMQNIDVLWGKTSLIFKEPLLIKLETKKKEIYKKAASIIQKFWNNYRFSINRKINVMDITYFSSETYCKAKKYNAVKIHLSSQSTHNRNDFRALYFGNGIISKQEIPKLSLAKSYTHSPSVQHYNSCHSSYVKHCYGGTTHTAAAFLPDSADSANLKVLLKSFTEKS